MELLDRLAKEDNEENKDDKGGKTIN